MLDEDIINDIYLSGIIIKIKKSRNITNYYYQHSLIV